MIPVIKDISEEPRSHQIFFFQNSLPVYPRNIQTALGPARCTCVSEEVSHKLFGENDPMGKTIRLYNALMQWLLGVFKTPASPSHLKVELVLRDLMKRVISSGKIFPIKHMPGLGIPIKTVTGE